MYEIEGLTRELALERQAHREARERAARATRAAQYWQCEARRLERGDPLPTPNPMPVPWAGAGAGGDAGGDGGGGHEAHELLLATLGCLARLGELLVTEDPLVGAHERRELGQLADRRMRRLLGLLGDPTTGSGDPKGGTQRLEGAAALQ